jgi:hypothetical protein
MRSRLAWTLAWVTLGLVVADTLVSAQVAPLVSETAVAVHGFPFVHGAVFGSALMGALIVSRYDRHPVGWILCAVGVLGSVSLLTEAYAFWVQEVDGPGPQALGSVSAWVSSLLGGQLLIAVLALMFLLAPDGRFASRRWRYVGGLAVLGAVLCLAAIASTSPTEFLLVASESEIGAARATMLTVGFLLITVGLVGSVVSLVQRLRRSSGAQRQQLRPIALAAALAAGGIVCLIVVQALNGGRQTWLASLPLFLSFCLMPVLFAVAVLRHRLYELDVIINRAAVLAAATLFAAVGYTLVVVVVGRQAGGFWFSLLVTASVAVAFQPVRRAVVRLANRLAYGPRAQPYEELAEFSSRLVETPSVSALLPAVAAAAGEAIAATSATASLGPASATWGETSSTADVHRVPVADGLGAIEVAIPRGRGLRAADARLLQALADRAAVAFRNVALADELADRVATLDRTTAELAESRARIVEADDRVRRELERAISRDVLPHLRAVSDGLRDGAPTMQLVDEVNAGLEALRELTRGVFPTRLARTGLRCLAPAVAVSPSVESRRFAPHVETAIYQCGADAASGHLDLDGNELVLTLPGVTSYDESVRDRVDAAGGTLVVSGQTLSVRVPAEPAQTSDSRSGPNVAFAT